MARGQHTLNAEGTRNTAGGDKQWAGVSYTPHCRQGCTCPSCGERLHAEAGEHFCPACYKYIAPNNKPFHEAKA